MPSSELLEYPVNQEAYENSQVYPMDVKRLSYHERQMLSDVDRAISDMTTSPSGKAIFRHLLASNIIANLMIDLSRYQRKENRYKDNQEIRRELNRIAINRIRDWSAFLLANERENRVDSKRLVTSPSTTFYLTKALLPKSGERSRWIEPNGFIATHDEVDPSLLHVTGVYKYVNSQRDWPDRERVFTEERAQWWRTLGRDVQLERPVTIGSRGQSITRVDFAEELEMKYIIPLGFDDDPSVATHTFPLTTYDTNTISRMVVTGLFGQELYRQQ